MGRNRRKRGGIHKVSLSESSTSAKRTTECKIDLWKYWELRQVTGAIGCYRRRFFFSSESSTTRGMTTECTSGVRRDAAAAVLTSLRQISQQIRTVKLTCQADLSHSCR
jgi:hypothetical protein